MSLRVVPITLEQANVFVRNFHRHHKPVTGQKFSVGVARKPYDGDRYIPVFMVGYVLQLSGVAIASRPVAPKLDDGVTLEITRCCTDGTRNACSMLYGAIRRAARALGYTRILTYTLPEEGGASLRAAGFRIDKEDAGGPARLRHNRPGRSVAPVGDDLLGGKWRWVA